MPSPCGPNSQCRAIGNTPACSCLPNNVGRAPNCRPECTISAECPSNLACQKERCRDPCPGSCGPRATCRVVNHGPVCTCLPGHTGDPFSGCSPVPPSKILLASFVDILAIYHFTIQKHSLNHLIAAEAFSEHFIFSMLSAPGRTATTTKHRKWYTLY